jgi:integrase
MPKRSPFQNLPTWLPARELARWLKISKTKADLLIAAAPYRQRRRFLEPEEEARLVAACEGPLRALVLLGIHTGLRLRSEAMTLQWTDVDQKRRTVTAQAAYAKTGLTRTVPLNSIVCAALDQLPPTGARVFPGLTVNSMRRGFVAACRKAGLCDVMPHTLRHTFETRLIENGVDLRTVQELGGWAQLKMLERYGHVTTARKADAVERLTTHEGFPPREKLRSVTPRP